VELRRRTVAGELGAPRVLSDESALAYNPQLAVDGSGRATVVWLAPPARVARTVAPDGTLSPIRDLAAG
ncbi:MAG TPA: hypothetical protein VF533_11680, partial [Solirubrobacteraceae bacterium]